MRQFFAFDELHHDGARRSGVLDPVNLSDVRMIQRGESLCFPFETREPLRVGCKSCRQNLDGDVPIEFRITGPIHLAHAALSNEGLDVVRAKACSWSEHLDVFLDSLRDAIIPNGNLRIATSPHADLLERSSVALRLACERALAYGILPGPAKSEPSVSTRRTDLSRMAWP